MTRWTIIAAVVIEGLSEYAKTAFAAMENERTVTGMAEYIDKWSVVNRLIDIENEFQQYKPFYGFEHAMYRKICEAEIAIGKTQAADVAPVRHGRWVEQEKYTFGTMYDCSICGNRILDNGHSWNYCPNCGAKMDEVIE